MSENKEFKWKIVNTFVRDVCGYYYDKKHAERALIEMENEFYSHLVNRNAVFTYEIVPYNYKWYFNGQKFVWGEP